MPSRSREDALSEVIGFILILALIAVLASLYLTYVVPAQGREGEIKHMATINDQFLGYKAAVDSLWINDQTNVPISRTFTLGTLTGTTQGSFVIPIFQPYPSSGSMVVNGRGESISIQADVLMDDYFGGDLNNPNPTYYSAPNHIYLQIKTTNNTNRDSLILKPDTGNWTACINVSSMVAPEASFSGSGGSALPYVPLLPDNAGANQIRYWIQTYLEPWITAVAGNIGSINMKSVPFFSITIVKNNNATFTGLPVIANIKNDTLYTIDLLDDTYGLGKELNYPFDLIVTKSPSDNGILSIDCIYPAQIGYKQQIFTQSHQMGSLEFLSNNKYWIQQNYYYQQGGVFLEQPGEGMVAKVMPLISITNETGIPSIKIIDAVINSSGQNNIGGTSSVQVVTTLSDINTENLARGFPNAKNVTLIIETDAVPVWNQIFTWVKINAEKDGKNPGVNESLIQIIPGTNTIQLTMDTSPDYKLYFDYVRVNMSVELQPVAI